MNLLSSKIYRWFKKPEYIYKPRQVMGRLRLFFNKDETLIQNVTIFKQQLSINPQETIGKSLLSFGVYDLVLTETIWRLVSSGAQTADIGANIGYFSLVFANRVGPYGTVHCFEPHPKLQKKWRQHLRKWEQCLFYPVALSTQEGQMSLFIPQQFSKNEGTASLEPIRGATEMKVPVTTLDRALAGRRVNFIKIDVEGHELEVLRGGEETLKHVEHIVFEDFKNEQSPVIQFLEQKGFVVFRLYKGLHKVYLLTIEEAKKIPLWEPPNYLATKDEAFVREKLATNGWKCLKFL